MTARVPLSFPKVRILAKRERIEDYVLEDFIVEGIKSSPSSNGNARIIIRRNSVSL